MSLSLAYWILMLVWLLLGVWVFWPDFRTGGLQLIPFVLFVMLGWRVLGAPIKG